MFMLLLTIDLGIRFLANPKEVVATERREYKVVSLESINTEAGYEQLLNDLANQGWELDETLVSAK